MAIEMDYCDFSFGVDWRIKFTTELNYPAVSGIADSCYKATTQQNIVPFDGFLKQFIGALVCTIMEANGYEKSGKKKSVPHHSFTKGEFYTYRLA